MSRAFSISGMAKFYPGKLTEAFPNRANPGARVKLHYWAKFVSKRKKRAGPDSQAYSDWAAA